VASNTALAMAAATGRIAFAGAGRWQFGTVDQHDVDRLGRLADVEYRIRKPVHTRDLGAVESVAAGR